MIKPSASSAGLPRTVRPMLARLARRPFDSLDYLYELKWDGIRAMAFIEGGHLKLLGRNSEDVTHLFPELADLPRQINEDGVVLDGELVCLDNQGQPSYSRLRRRLGTSDGRGARSNPVHFIAFDLLYVGGRSVMAEPLLDRKGLLRDLLLTSKVGHACEFIENDGEAFFRATCDMGLEGIVAKEKFSLYFPGKRSRNWLKVKRVRESDFVIAGYTFRGGRKEVFSSLVLGLYDNERQLIYVGQVATGISRKIARGLAPVLQEAHTAECPFEALPDVRKLIFWCRPELVCQLEYGEFTEGGDLAYPVFKGLRDDKSPTECAVADAPGWPDILADFA